MSTVNRLASFEFLEDTREGKIWHIEAIHVTTTRNQRKYTQNELQAAARSLSFRPLNINHDDSQMLPYPENETLEMDFDANKNAVSGRMRVNSSEINRMIEQGLINKLSVEQIPIKGETCGCSLVEGCACEQHGITFVGLALLTADKQPGDPMTEIRSESAEPLKIQEALLESLVAPKPTINPDNFATLTNTYAYPVTSTTTASNYDANLTFTVSTEEARSQLETKGWNLEGSMKCPKCGEECDTAQEMANHMIKEHVEDEEEKLKEADYPWEDCIADQKKNGNDDESAKKICGYIKAKYGGESYQEAKQKIMAEKMEDIAGVAGISNVDNKKKKKDVEETLLEGLKESAMGDCITHFKDEGKPHDQALAICLNTDDPAKYAEAESILLEDLGRVKGGAVKQSQSCADDMTFNPETGKCDPKYDQSQMSKDDLKFPDTPPMGKINNSVN